MDARQLEVDQRRPPIGPHQHVLLLVQIVVADPACVELTHQALQVDEEVAGQSLRPVQGLPIEEAPAQHAALEVPHQGRHGIETGEQPQGPVLAPREDSRHHARTRQATAVRHPHDGRLRSLMQLHAPEHVGLEHTNSGPHHAVVGGSGLGLRSNGHAPYSPHAMPTGKHTHAADAQDRDSRPGGRDESAWRFFTGPLLSLATVLVLLGGFEAFLRLTGDRDEALATGLNRTHRRWASLVQSDFFEEISDPVRRYAMRPGAEYEVDGWQFVVNSHRTRGAELPQPKPANERRILALGDSFCFGMWCDEDETVVGELARRANEAERAAGTPTTWRAINTGVPGYHSGQQLRALVQDGLELEPDLVLLYFNTNDILGDGFFYDEDLRVLYSDSMPLPTTWRRRLWASHLYGWLERHRERGLSTGGAPHLSATGPFSHNLPANRLATAEALAGIVAACEAADVPLFAIHQPLMSWMGDARSPEWEILPLVDWAEAQFDRLGVPHVNLLGWMRGYRDGVDRGPEGVGPPHEFQLEQYFADEDVQAYLAALARGSAPESVELPTEPDFHLTAEGYAELARLAYGPLRERGWLP